MTCQKINKGCNCDFNLKSFGLCDPKRITIDGSDRTVLNWNEISVPEILCVPEAKPDIENLDQIYANAELTSVKLIETPFAYKTVHVLASASLVASLNTIITKIGTLVGSINALFTPTTGLIPVLLNAISAAFPRVPVPSYVTASIDALNAALFNLTSYIATIDLTGNVLSATLYTASKTISSLLAVLSKALQDLADSLETSVLSLVPASNVLSTNYLQPVLNAIADLINNGDPTANPPIPPTTASIAGILAALVNLIGLIGSVSYITIAKNEEGTCLSGRKLVIEGFLNQKVVYTGNVDIQSVHSAHYSIPFSVFIVVYPKFENLDYQPNVVVNILDENGDPIQKTISGIGISSPNKNPELIPDLCEEFCVEAYIEDIFATALDPRTIFKNVTLFFLAKPSLC